MTATNLKTCPACALEVPAAAKKCHHCMEVLDGADSSVEPRNNRLEYFRASVDGIGKLAIPLAILGALLLFRSDLQNLLARAKSAEFAGNAITFDLPQVSNRPIELPPKSLYYLLGAAMNNSRYNYDGLERNGDLESIHLLETKRLARMVVTNREPTDKRDRNVFGTRSLAIEVLPLGKEFLKAIGLDPDG